MALQFDAGSSLAVSGYLVFVLFVAAVWRLTQKLRLVGAAPLPRLFLGLLAASLLLRSLWFLAKAASDDHDSLQVVNRLSVTLLFTAYSIYVLTWARAVVPFGRGQVSAQVRSTTGRCARCRSLCKGVQPVQFRTCLVANAVVWVATIVLLIARQQLMAAGDTDAEDIVYDVDIGFIAVTSLVLVGVFGRYGFLLHRMLSNTKMQSVSVVTARRKITIAASACAVFWALRSVMFLWRPITGQAYFTGMWDDFFYPWAFYTWPDMVPALTMLVLLAPKRIHRKPGGTSSAASTSRAKHGDPEQAGPLGRPSVELGSAGRAPSGGTGAPSDGPADGGEGSGAVVGGHGAADEQPRDVVNPLLARGK